MTAELLQSGISKVPTAMLDLLSDPAYRKNNRVREALTVSSSLLLHQLDYGKTFIPMYSVFTDMGEIKGYECVKVDLYGKLSKTMPLTGSFEFRGWIESKEEGYYLVRGDDKERFRNEQT